MSDSFSTSVLPGLETHLGYWLRRASNPISAEFARALQIRQVSVAEWVALRHLYDRPDLTPGELAELLGMTRGAVSKVLDKLQSKEWITSHIKPEDHRVQTLALTPKGATLLPELVEIANNNDQEFFGCLNSEEQATLRKLLQKLTDAHQWKNVPID